jgi:hypothetical protein
MTLLDILLEVVEDRLYKEAIEEHRQKEEKLKENEFPTLRDKDYVPGYGNWLTPGEDNMTDEDQDILFDKIRF